MTDEEIKIMCDRMDVSYLAHEKRNKRLESRIRRMGIEPFTHHISNEEKIQILSDWADKYKDIDVFVETGTRRAKTLLALRDKFKKLYSVEISNRWYKESINNYKKAGSPKHIKIEKGDCLSFLPKTLRKVRGRCLIWLDAHGTDGTPVLEELDIIFNDKIKDHVILVDDAYDFSRGHLNYPSVYHIRDLALENGYNFTMENERAPEVMILYPK
tara:strand:+ start:7173 stop:7814 length:642 start_codon:yes stop_codon:yes gene_type:complete